MEGVLLTGAPGVGKTAVAIELAREPGTVAVDLDWLGWMAPEQGSVDDLIVRNLESILPNLEAAGARRLVLARCVIDSGFVTRLPIRPLTVVRLTAPPEILRERLRARDTGAELEQHLVELDTLLTASAAAARDAVVIDTTERSVQDVAAEVRRFGFS